LNKIALREEPEIDFDSLRRETLQLCQAIETGYLSLARMLYTIRNRYAYLKWGYESFEQYVEEELKISLRKAEYFVFIYARIKSLAPRLIQKFESLGWSKARLILDHAKNESEAALLVEEASKSSVRGLQKKLQQRVKLQKPDPREKLSFKLKPQQKRLISQALKVARGLSREKDSGEILSLICSYFLANSTGGNPKEELEIFLQKVERWFGVKLIALNENNEVLFGGELVK